MESVNSQGKGRARRPSPWAYGKQRCMGWVHRSRDEKSWRAGVAPPLPKELGVCVQLASEGAAGLARPALHGAVVGCRAVQLLHVGLHAAGALVALLGLLGRCARGLQRVQPRGCLVVLPALHCRARQGQHLQPAHLSRCTPSGRAQILWPATSCSRQHRARWRGRPIRLTVRVMIIPGWKRPQGAPGPCVGGGRRGEPGKCTGGEESTLQAMLEAEATSRSLSKFLSWAW